MAFVRIWLTGYWSPPRMVAGLEGKPAPHWGFYGELTRALLDALLLYLPLALMGRQPSTPSYVSLFPTDRYYATLVWLAPIVLLVQWLFLCAAVHGILRLLGRRSNIDQIMNVTGMVTLVVGTFLVLWDWLWIALGWRDPIWLGISHLVLDGWGIWITVLGFRRLLGVPVGLAILLNVVWIVLGLPLAMLFMRAPV